MCLTEEFSCISPTSTCVSQHDNNGVLHCSQSEQIASEGGSWNPSTIPSSYAHIFISCSSYPCRQPKPRCGRSDVNIICHPVHLLEDVARNAHLCGCISCRKDVYVCVVCPSAVLNGWHWWRSDKGRLWCVAGVGIGSMSNASSRPFRSTTFSTRKHLRPSSHSKVL